ncbi:hypothetical protein KKB99_03950 [bacterium]|nr:hypothetical protein [bacterium]MBU1025146.1 hypothetical protein [bacterium]
MLKKKIPKEPPPLLVNAVNSTRKMLMHRGYYIKEVITASDFEIDLIAIREGLIHSDRLRMRLVLHDAKSGLGLESVKRFFQEQARVFGIEGILISLTPISKQAKKMIEKYGLNVFGPDWLKENSDFDPNEK